MEFMAAILRGEKKALTNDEVSQICLPKTLYLTKEKLCEQVEQNKALMEFFPENVREHCDRQFLLDVINTLMPKYFVSVLDEIDGIRQIKGGAEPQEVQIDQGMMAMLRDLSGPASSRKNLRGLNQLRVGARKRKKPDFKQDYSLSRTPSLATTPVRSDIRGLQPVHKRVRLNQQQ